MRYDLNFVFCLSNISRHPPDSISGPCLLDQSLVHILVVCLFVSLTVSLERWLLTSYMFLCYFMILCSSTRGKLGNGSNTGIKVSLDFLLLSFIRHCLSLLGYFIIDHRPGLFHSGSYLSIDMLRVRRQKVKHHQKRLAGQPEAEGGLCFAVAHGSLSLSVSVEFFMVFALIS